MSLQQRAERVAEKVGLFAIDDRNSDWAELLLIQIEALITQPRQNVGAEVELIGRRMMDS